MEPNSSETGFNSACFEENLKNLEDIVAKLERGELGLEESIRFYKQGAALHKTLQEKLRQVEAEIKIVLEETNGTINTTGYENL